MASPSDNKALTHWDIRPLVSKGIGREVDPADNPASLSLTTRCASLH
ncbi:hypothetical protein MKY87_23610 [Paenibacillus sp. FSL R7-0198]